MRSHSSVVPGNGAPVRLGRQVGVPTPVNALVTRLVHAKERFAGL